MGFSHKHLFVTLISFVILFEMQTCLVDADSANSNQWQPLLKGSNKTKEWKAMPKAQTQTTNDGDLSATASLRHDSITSPATHHTSLSHHDQMDHESHHMQHHYNHQHYPPLYETIPHAGARYEPISDPDGYHYPSYGVPGHPSYGPPHNHPPSFPDDSIHIELAFDRLVIRCIVQDPLEHIVWTRYPCPNEYFYGNGLPVADGSVVHNTDLYDVHIVGEKGEIASELLLRSPLDPSTSGLYICEAWPHYHKPSEAFGHGHYQPPAYPSQSDAFIIGGSELIDQCYLNHKAPFVHKPFPFKKRYDHDDVDTHKTTKHQPSKKQSDSLVDAMRKPRNSTAFNARKHNSLNFFDKDVVPFISYSRPRHINSTDHRYNVKFANKTFIQNVTADNIFNRFQTVKLPTDNQTPNAKANTSAPHKSLNFKSHFLETNLQNNYTNDYHFVINRVKLSGHHTSDPENKENSSHTDHFSSWDFLRKHKILKNNTAPV